MLSGKEALSIIESEFPQLNYGVKLKDAWQALERVVEIANSAQQLKNEINAFANELSDIHIKDCDIANVKDLVERMRQLSAI